MVIKTKGVEIKRKEKLEKSKESLGNEKTPRDLCHKSWLKLLCLFRITL